MKMPEELQEKYNEIAVMIVNFCNEKLNKDYEELCLRLLTKLCRKRPSPLLGGRTHTWAAGIIYAIGSNNFVFDKTQKLHLTAYEIASPFGISVSTAGSKAAELKKMFKINFMNIEWMLPEYIDDHPAVWMLTINGLIVDIRSMPIEVQRQAYQQGFIPYIPGEREKPESEKSTNEKQIDSQGRIIEKKKTVKPEHPDQELLFPD